ncbi:MAG: hypothetical protein WDA75_25880 [Candidatus Latescibacterota bacterium]|jgi:hypothetical protein
MKAMFVLTPSESKRLIARAVVMLPEVQQALRSAYVCVVGGTTNGFIAQELAGLAVEPQRYTAGTSTRGVVCVTPPAGREGSIPLVLHRGQVVAKTLKEVFEDFHLDTVIIKGANAVDAEGNVGIITSGFDGGTVAATIGYMTSTGMRYIFPVGLEKLVPSVPEAARWAGSKTFDYSMGAPFGIYCLSNGVVVTEIQALEVLAEVETVQVASGGIGGSEGAVVLISQGEESQVRQAIAAVEAVKGEPPVLGLKGVCSQCPYERCTYHGLEEDRLPAWLQNGRN